MERKFGVLMPVFSLDGNYGIGSFGASAYEFVDFLSASGVGAWQVLPLCPVGYGASPYSSPCGDAIDPNYIDLEILIKKGLLTKSECDACDFGSTSRVDYLKLKKERIKLLKKAFSRFDGELDGYEDYALFMALKEAHADAPWYEWGEAADHASKATCEFAKQHSDELKFWQFLQVEAHEQWFALRAYANRKRVELIGDLPFYVSHDSVEVWRDRTQFALNGYYPESVAGVPPDYFSKTGQMWGNPVYVWHNMANFVWWNKRLTDALALFDRLRLDHFRAFDEYYAIPYGSKNAKKGEWKQGPGFEFFKDKTNLPIIAEDLGIITDSVRRLLSRTGFPGMRVLQFGFDGDDNPHAPCNIGKNCVCYTSTHDNMTLAEFVGSLRGEYGRIAAVLGEWLGETISCNKDELIDAMIEAGCGSDARLFITPMQDLLHLGKGYRINRPSTVSVNNWSIRIRRSYDAAGKYLSYLTKKYNRSCRSVD